LSTEFIIDGSGGIHFRFLLEVQEMGLARIKVNDKAAVTETSQITKNDFSISRQDKVGLELGYFNIAGSG